MKIDWGTIQIFAFIGLFSAAVALAGFVGAIKVIAWYQIAFNGCN